MSELIVGDIIQEKSDTGVNCYSIVLEVTKRRKRKGENCDKPGLYLFHGMWYGRYPLNIGAFGKIESLPVEGQEYKLIGNVADLGIEKARNLLQGKEN